MKDANLREYIFPLNQRRPEKFNYPACSINRNVYKRKNKDGSLADDRRVVIRFYLEAVKELELQPRDRVLFFWENGDLNMEILQDTDLRKAFTVGKESGKILKINIPQLYDTHLQDGFYELAKMYENDDYIWTFTFRRKK